MHFKLARRDAHKMTLQIEMVKKNGRLLLPQAQERPTSRVQRGVLVSPLIDVLLPPYPVAVRHDESQ